MKKYMCLILACLLMFSICACGSQSEEEEADLPVVDIVEPIPFMNTDNLADATLQVEFSADDLSADGTSLTVRIYDMVLYDALEVSLLEIGKTIVDENGNEIIVETKEDADGCVNINGGVENGGMTLYAGDGGTYYLKTADEYGTMYLTGEETFPISEECIITDNADIDNPDITVALSDFGSYLRGDSFSFNCLNTQIRLVEGMIVEINRLYMA